MGMGRFVKPAFEVTFAVPVPRLERLTIPPFELAFAGFGVAERGVGFPSSLG